MRAVTFMPILAVVAAIAITSGSTPSAAASSPPESSTFATVSVEKSATVRPPSDGDLWPTCWSNDDALYTANGDGAGFTTSGPAADIAVSRVTGGVGSLSGSTIARGGQLGQIWSGSGYNRKPTGMVCVDGAIYMAVQDLSLDFNDAPAATIAKSTDHGLTWAWDTSGPMFSSHVFTTVFFADFGKNNVDAPDGYVYAYGLDGNWRTSYDQSVADPVDLYLARVPKSSIQNRSTWQFFAGLSGSAATWTSDIGQRQPVLHDDERIYQTTLLGGANNLTRLAQGGVLYNKPLGRYIYTTWTEYTHEFYDSPTPFGPWTHVATQDYGGYPWTTTKNGGYGTTLPSKFLSSDGLTAYLQSNVCPCANGGVSVYGFALRKVTLVPGPTSAVSNPLAPTNLAQAPGTVPVARVAHFGTLNVLNDGNLANSEDDWNNELKAGESWWGYTWPRKYTINQVSFTAGDSFTNGGWFSSALRVQVRNGNSWTNVASTALTPGYPYASVPAHHQTYTFSFPSTTADGVRVIGKPGGSGTFTSIAELAVRNAAPGTTGGDILTKYNAMGGSGGPLGPATTDELSTTSAAWGAGRFNHFQNNASIYWSSATGAHEVHGAIHTKWASLGWEQATGFPTTDESTTPDAVGRYSHFQGGSIYWTPSTGAHVVYGVIRSKWSSLGWETGALGYPTSDEYNVTGGKRSDFQNGYIVFNSSTGAATAYRTNGSVLP